jgi:bacterioferritin
MKGKDKVISILNDLLTAELTAIDVYFLYSRIFEDQGYNKIYQQLSHEMDDERGHADLIMKRILFLEGTPNIGARLAVEAKRDIVECYEISLKFEYMVRDSLKDAIHIAFDEDDHVTREILEKLLVDTESDHIRWFESQLGIIKQIGKENYLQEHM